MHLELKDRIIDKLYDYSVWIVLLAVVVISIMVIAVIYSWK